MGMRPSSWRALGWRRAVGLVSGLALCVISPCAAAQLPPAAAPGAPEIRFGPEADYGPFVYQGEGGRAEGLSIDMLGLVQRQAGLRVQTLPARPLNEWLALARRGEVDLLSSLRPTPERADYLLFSLPYVRVPAVLVVRAGHPLAGGTDTVALAPLHGRPVAVGAGYAVESFVRSRQPGVAWQAVPDDVVALRGVADGRFEAAVVDTASASFIARRHGIKGLATAGPVGFEYMLSFAVRKDRPELLEAVDAGIRAIPAAERAAVVERWLAPLDVPLDVAVASWGPRRVAIIGFGLIALGLAVGLWGWLRHRRAPAETEL
jgi:ABC-type amino acid transport substrate-binding protein